MRKAIVKRQIEELKVFKLLLKLKYFIWIIMAFKSWKKIMSRYWYNKECTVQYLSKELLLRAYSSVSENIFFSCKNFILK